MELRKFKNIRIKNHSKLFLCLRRKLLVTLTLSNDF